MFIQVIQSRSSRQDEVRALMKEWGQQSDEGTGFLGSTSGFTDDGDFITVVRFESEEKAMANSDRPETSAMAERMAALMDGPPQFQDCNDVTEWLGGGSDDAGFVQVIQGHTDDADRLKSVMQQNEDELREHRPDIIGGTMALADDGSFTNTAYFTDEASAREGEKKDVTSNGQEFRSLMQDVVFHDLRDPWFESA
jgi:hypothetical protein